MSKSNSKSKLINHNINNKYITSRPNFSDNIKSILNHKKEENNYSSVRSKSKSFRDMVINNNDKFSRNKEINSVKENELNTVETPKFDINQTKTLDKIDLRLFSFNSINEDDQDIFDLKTKIIKQSSNLEYNQRRIKNLNNAMNKIKSKNNNSSINTKSNPKKINQENEKQNNFNNNIINNQFNKKDRYLKLLESNYSEENEKINLRTINKKYPEPFDIDTNLININPDIFKNDRNIIKIENKNDKNGENLFFINNRKRNSFTNNNNSFNSNNSYSMVKEIQNNNNNSTYGKNNSYMNLSNINNNYNVHDITNNNPNLSLGEQISYLENNIKKFEKTFGK